ncbi:MAG: response regulator transcription factor [Acidimicrobiales bacterium]|nr:response regulator transcription factor [Acidimicrobiales bacterium]
MGGTILIIEDEHDIAELVASRLRSAGYTAEVCHDGLTGVDRCAELEPDLVVLDLVLPGLDGVEVCRRIQQARRVPVVMLTAKDDETDLLVGLGVGADDYLTKPFSPRELVARIGAVLRRSTDGAVATDRLLFGDVAVDVAARTVARAGRPVHLTATEFDLVRVLLVADGAVLTRQQLLSEVWGYRDGSGARTVDSHVRALRRKLGDDIVRTVHGVGYALGQPDAT